MTPQQIRNRQLASAELPPEDYEPDLRDGDWIQVCETVGHPPSENRYLAFVVEIIEHGYYLLVECRLESGDTRRFETYRDGPPELGVVGVKVLRRVDRPPEPQPELGQLYGKRSTVRRTAHPRASEVTIGSRFRAKIQGYYSTVLISGRQKGRWIGQDLQTGRPIHIRSVNQLRKLEKCPRCNCLHYEIPTAGWPCLRCRLIDTL